VLAAGDVRQQKQRARGQRLRVVAVRAPLAVHLLTQIGLSLADTARQLGVSTSGIAKAVTRAERRNVH